MENIEIPKWAKGQLLEGEKVISRLSHGTADYYATDRRLLRFKSKSECDVLEYAKMRITFRKYGLGRSIFRVIAVLIGLLSIGLGVLGFVGPTFHYGTTVMHTQAPLEVSLLLWVVGLFLIVGALNFHYAYYQIEGLGLDNKNLKEWRIVRNRWGSAKADRFARIVKEVLGGLASTG